ncbi:MAG: sugar-binding domain-containing protein [Calditrichia bacterium]
MLLPLQSRLLGEDWNRLVELRGIWKFEIGDNLLWADPQFDDSKWEDIFVPAAWEDEGYPGYDGYAWYRKTFRIDKTHKGKAIYLRLGYVDDVDEVYLNGHFLAFSGSFPPHYQTSYQYEHIYYIPEEYLNFSGDNLLAVRIYDEEISGGIIDGKIGLYELKNYLYPDLNFQGKWKFQAGDNEQWRVETFNDSSWDSVYVPGYWETQGYKDYDGFGWYRYEFKIPDNLKGKKLILLLGRIDDLDETYLNGHRIGKTGHIENEPSRISLDNYYTEMRAYFIPGEKIYQDSLNTLAVRVYDGMLHGGIYDGPVGIVTREKYLEWQATLDSEKKKFRNLLDFIFPDWNN